MRRLWWVVALALVGCDDGGDGAAQQETDAAAAGGQGGEGTAGTGGEGTAGTGGEGTAGTGGEGAGGAGGGGGEGAAGGPCLPDPAGFAAQRPTLETYCGLCHSETPAFGAPFTLLDPAALLAGEPGRRQVDRLVTRLRGDTMPPIGQPEVPSSDKAALLDWATCGTDPGVTPNPGGFEVTREVLPDPGTRPESALTVDWRATDGGIGLIDDTYRCWSFGGTDDERFIQRIEPLIDDGRVLHHMVLYQVGGGPADGSEVGCGTSVSQIVYAWAPGQQALSFPEGGLRTGPDRRYVLEIHYNNLARVPGVQDESGVRVYHGEPRGTEYGMLVLGPEGFVVPEGQSAVDSQCNVPESLHVLASMPHMHGLGYRLESAIRRAGGATEDLITLTDWDFNFQAYYAVGLDLAPGDEIVTTCTYRNDTGSPARYGPWTSDEMCYNFVYVTPPPQAGHCDGPVAPLPGGRYAPGECAAEAARTADPPEVMASWHEGVPEPLTGGAPPDGLYLLAGTEVWLVSYNLGIATLESARTTFPLRGTFSLVGGAISLDFQGVVHLVSVEGPALDRPVNTSLGGPLLSVDPAGVATATLQCGGDGVVAFPYAFEGDRLTIDLPAEGLEGVVRVFFDYAE